MWQLVHALEDSIINGELAEGEYIYPTRVIMNRYNVSDKTAQRAIGILHLREILELESGKGLRLLPGSRRAVIWHRTEQLKSDIKKLYSEAQHLGLTSTDFTRLIPATTQLTA